MTCPTDSTNTPVFHVGDLIVLHQNVYLRGLDKTVPAGILGIVQWVDDESSDLLVKLLDYFGWLDHWRNRIPVTSSQISIVIGSR
jgi:hypothetical protein